MSNKWDERKLEHPVYLLQYLAHELNEQEHLYMEDGELLDFVCEHVPLVRNHLVFPDGRRYRLVENWVFSCGGNNYICVKYKHHTFCLVLDRKVSAIRDDFTGETLGTTYTFEWLFAVFNR